MRIEPDRSKLQVDPDQPDRAGEIASKTNPPTLDADYLEMADESQNIFQQDAQPVAPTSQEIKAKLEAAMENRTDAETQERISQPMSTGGGGGPEAAKSKDGYTIIDTSMGGDPHVIAGSKDALPEDLRDLGTYEGGTDIISGDWYVYQRSRIQEASGDWGRVYGNNQLNVGGLDGRIFYESATFDEDGSLKTGIGAEAKIQVIATYYEVGYETPSLDVAGHDLNLRTEIDAEVEIGAKGFVIAEASVGKDTHIQLRAEAFAGVNTEVEVTESVGDYAEVHGGIGASIGFGVSGSIDIGWKDGEFGVYVDDFGGAVGGGATIDAGFSVDFFEIGSTIYDLGQGAGATADASRASDGFELARNFWESRGEFAKGAAETSRGVMEDVQQAVESFAEEAAETAEDVAEEAVETAEEVVEEVTEAVEDTAEDVANTAEDAWNDFWD